MIEMPIEEVVNTFIKLNNQLPNIKEFNDKERAFIGSCMLYYMAMCGADLGVGALVKLRRWTEDFKKKFTTQAN